MRLSEAILAGSTLIPWGLGMSFCDCALGMACAAVGRQGDEYFEAQAIWPWISNLCPTDPQLARFASRWRFVEAISHRYFEVVNKRMTIEQLCDYVRSVEPAEEAPRCAEPAETCTDAVSQGVA